jgi:hypothetical protein
MTVILLFCKKLQNSSLMGREERQRLLTLQVTDFAIGLKNSLISIA